MLLYTKENKQKEIKMENVNNTKIIDLINSLVNNINEFINDTLLVEHIFYDLCIDEFYLSDSIKDISLTESFKYIFNDLNLCDDAVYYAKDDYCFTDRDEAIKILTNDAYDIDNIDIELASLKDCIIIQNTWNGEYRRINLRERNDIYKYTYHISNIVDTIRLQYNNLLNLVDVSILDLLNIEYDIDLITIYDIENIISKIKDIVISTEVIELSL